MAGSDGKLSILAKVADNVKKKFAGKSSSRIRGVITTWVVCMALLFFIIPLMIGMYASGFIDFSNPLALILGIVSAVIFIVIGGFLP